RPFKIDVEYGVPMFFRQKFHLTILDTGGESVARNAGVVDEDMESPEVRYGGIHHLLHIRFRGDVADHGDTLTTRCFDELFRFCQSRFIDIGDHYMCALFSEACGGGSSNAVCPACNERHLILE